MNLPHTHFLCLLNISVLVDIDMADPISVSEHRDPPPCQLHDATNEVVAAARNHKVDLLV